MAVFNISFEICFISIAILSVLLSHLLVLAFFYNSSIIMFFTTTSGTQSGRRQFQTRSGRGHINTTNNCPATGDAASPQQPQTCTPSSTAAQQTASTASCTTDDLKKSVKKILASHEDFVKDGPRLPHVKGAARSSSKDINNTMPAAQRATSAGNITNNMSPTAHNTSTSSPRSTKKKSKDEENFPARLAEKVGSARKTLDKLVLRPLIEPVDEEGNPMPALTKKNIGPDVAANREIMKKNCSSASLHSTSSVQKLRKIKKSNKRWERRQREARAKALGMAMQRRRELLSARGRSGSSGSDYSEEEINMSSDLEGEITHINSGDDVEGTTLVVRSSMRELSGKKAKKTSPGRTTRKETTRGERVPERHAESPGRSSRSVSPAASRGGSPAASRGSPVSRKSEKMIISAEVHHQQSANINNLDNGAGGENAADTNLLRVSNIVDSSAQLSKLDASAASGRARPLDAMTAALWVQLICTVCTFF